MVAIWIMSQMHLDHRNLVKAIKVWLGHGNSGCYQHIMCTSLAKLCFVTLQGRSLRFSGYQIAHTLAGMRSCRFHKPERELATERHTNICHLHRPIYNASKLSWGLRGYGAEGGRAPRWSLLLYIWLVSSRLFGSHAEDGTRKAWPNRAQGVMGRSKKGSVFPHSSFPSPLALPLTALLSLIRTLRCGDGDGNENVGKTTCLHVHHAFCTSFCRHCTTTTWKFLISSFLEEVNKQRRSFLFSELGYGSCEFNPRKVRVHLIR